MILINSIIFIVQMIVPFFYMSDKFRNNFELPEYGASMFRTVSILFEVAYLTLIVIWTICSVTRVLVNVRRNYLDAYNQHKSQYIEMALVLAISTFTMIFLNILNVLSQECMHNEASQCSSLL